MFREGSGKVQVRLRRDPGKVLRNVQQKLQVRFRAGSGKVPKKFSSGKAQAMFSGSFSGRFR